MKVYTYLDKVYHAILRINSDAKYSILGEDINNIQWNHGTTPISISDIEAKIAEMKSEFDTTDYNGA
jgi:hypothetical protein|tara:strand:- start:175 stop:375 length:201 start_codon:yes stop_codon:yes gene_type:complete